MTNSVILKSTVDFKNDGTNIKELTFKIDRDLVSPYDEKLNTLLENSIYKTLLDYKEPDTTVYEELIKLGNLNNE